MPPALYFFKTKTLSFSNLDIYCFFVLLFSFITAEPEHMSKTERENKSKRHTDTQHVHQPQPPHLSSASDRLEIPVKSQIWGSVYSV